MLLQGLEAVRLFDPDDDCRFFLVSRSPHPWPQTSGCPHEDIAFYKRLGLRPFKCARLIMLPTYVEFLYILYGPSASVRCPTAPRTARVPTHFMRKRFRSPKPKRKRKAAPKIVCTAAITLRHAGRFSIRWESKKSLRRPKTFSMFAALRPNDCQGARESAVKNASVPITAK